MDISHLNQWLSDREVRAFCWTLIHSLWQGLLTAALAGLVIAATRKASAQMRYNLFCALLVIFLLAMGCTFIYEIGWESPKSGAQQVINIATDGTVSHDTVLINGKYSFLNALTGFLNSQAAGIFAVWLVCFFYKSLRLLGGVFYIHHIRTQNTEQVANALKDKVTDVAQRIGISRKVGIIQSALVKVPVTLGYLKPLIVLPAGIVLQLSAEQIETILWHELAHIRRRDYLVNILQSIVEAILFFNPAVLWLSALIREEREACCDDIVLANVVQKGTYLEALMAFQGQYSAGSIAMALSLRPNQLMNRLRRMVYRENKKLSILEMLVLLSGLMVFSAFTFIPQAKPMFKSSVAFIKNSITHTVAETQTLKQAKHKYIHVKANTHDTLKIETDAIIATADTAIEFKSILFNKSNADRTNCEMNVIDGRNNRYHIIVANGQIAALKMNENTIAETEFKNYQELIDQINNVKKRMVATATEPQPHSGKKRRVDSVPFKATMGLKESRKLVNKADSIVPVAFNQKPKKRPRHIDISADQARVHGVIQDLINAKVVANADEVESFGLSDTELFVNNKKQPDVLQRKLMETYGIKPKFGLYYGPVHMNGIGVILDKKDLWL